MRLFNTESINGMNAAVEMSHSEIGSILATFTVTIPMKRSNLAKAKLGGNLDAMQLKALEDSLAGDIRTLEFLTLLHSTMEPLTTKDLEDEHADLLEQYGPEGDGAVKS